MDKITKKTWTQPDLIAYGTVHELTGNLIGEGDGLDCSDDSLSDIGFPGFDDLPGEDQLE